MSNFLIAFLFGAGAGTWIYSKIYKNTGGNNKSALTTAGIGGFILFLLMLIILSFIMD